MGRELDVERPPHFGEGPEERTQIDPPADYPAAAEMEPPKPTGEMVEQPLSVLVANMPQPTREVLEWSSNRYPIGTRPIRIAGRDPKRRRLLIRNDDSTVAVYLGRHELDAVYTMFELHAGTNGTERATVEFLHQSEVWAVCDTGNSTTISVFQEYALRTE